MYGSLSNARVSPIDHSGEIQQIGRRSKIEKCFPLFIEFAQLIVPYPGGGVLAGDYQALTLDVAINGKTA